MCKQRILPSGPAPRRTAQSVRLRCLTLTVIAAVFGLVLIAPSSALAVFTRPFVRQITGTTPAGPGTPVVPFSGPSGVAVDAAGNLWVSEPIPGRLDEFNSAGSFVKSVELGKKGNEAEENLTPPKSLAIDYSTGHFFITGEGNRKGFAEPYVEVFDSIGVLFKRWEGFGPPAHVAVDNSTDPLDPSGCSLSVCTVYVSHGSRNPPPEFGGDGLAQGIEKFDSSGKPVPFEETASYVEGSEITGTPSGRFKSVTPTPGGITVDSHGNIYAIASIEHGNVEEPQAVYEYSPTGAFVRAFTGGKTPGLGGSHGEGGFGGELGGVAVDPASGHVVVSVSSTAFGVNEGAVDEFDSTTGEFVDQITETEIEVSPGVRERGRLHSAFEMTVDSQGDLYVVDSRSEHPAVDVYGPGHFLPSLKIAEATQREPEGALLSGSVDPESLPLTECAFEYVAEAAFEKTGFSDLSSGGKVPCVPAAGSIPADSSFHPVEAKINGLTSGTTYRYRIVATSSGALGGTAASGSPAFTAPHAPRVDSNSATDLSSTFADLRAQINPLGADTTYIFQYVEGFHYEPAAEDPYANGATAPATEASIGSGGPTGSADASVVQQIGGLARGTTYHFRVVAKNKVGTTYGPDRMFTTVPQVVPGLPDNRAYELVTPPNKGSAEDMFIASEEERNIFNNKDVGYPSETGDGFLLDTRAAFGSFAASGENAYVFSRTAAGWRTIPVAPPSLGVQDLNVPVFQSSGFSQVGIEDTIGSSVTVGGQHKTMLVGPPGGPYTTIRSDAGVSEKATMVGASHDLNRIVLESKNHTLAPGDESQDLGSNALYEWAGGEFTLVNVDSEGSLLNHCGAMLGQSSHLAGTRHDAVSADGSKVFFTAPDPYMRNDGTTSTSGCWNGATSNAPQLYMRSGGETIQVSAPEEGVKPSARYPAIYVGASEDGAKVFFVTETEMTKNDEGKAHEHIPELYEYDTQTRMLTRISAGESSNAVADVFTVPAISSEGSGVYFTAFGRLTSAAPAVSHEEVNLYHYDTGTGRTAYVATVSEPDYPSTLPYGWWVGTSVNLPLQVSLAPNANWYTNPDGRYLLFTTARELTGYSTAEASPLDCPALDSQFANRSGHCPEVYRYDAGAAEKHEEPIVCVSCNPSGAQPTSSAFFGHSAGAETAAGGPVRAMSDNGSYAFFDTADALVPQDSNGTLDVYEWHEGRISLISSGRDSSPSFFLGTTPDASDVFFGTHARLVPQDRDGAGDLYDARIGGGFPPPSSEGGVCEGDACQNPPPAPIDATPGSLTFLGAGNVPGEDKRQITPKKGEPTNAQNLAKALKVCRKKPKSHRKKCKSQARRRYAKKATKWVSARHANMTSGRAGK
jgi:hypothetical protein